SVLSLFVIAFTYNRSILKSVMGVQLGLILFFIILFILVYFFPSLGIIDDQTSKQYVSLEILQFNVFFFGLIGLGLAIISALSVSYFILKDNSESAYKMLSSEFATNQSYETGIITSVLFVIITGISLF